MKILFINISDIQGGSAKAAYRLGKALENKHKTENLFLVRTKRSNTANVLQTRKNGFQSFIERAVNILMNILGLQYQWLPFSPIFILNKAREFKPDVISLQNTIGGYFKTKDLIKLSQIAPVVWTLHDMWAFTRNASYTFGNESWKTGKTFNGENKIFPWIGFNNGNFLLKQKERVYSQTELSIITPSKWLAGLVKQSPALQKKNIHHVFNGIDLKIFCLGDKQVLKNKYGINPKQKVLMFIAENLKKKNWKLGSELQEILTEINTALKEKITIIILGNGHMPYLNELHNYEIKQQGYVYDDNMISELLSLSDLFIYPSMQDNLPTVLIESIACGTPCITFDTGGCGEIIINNYNGILIEPFDVKIFSKSVLDLLDDELKLQMFSRNAKKYAEQNFSVEQMAVNYLEVFNSVKK